MGVPAFFRWLSRKYPSIVVHCTEEKAKTLGDVTVPVDTSQPNPNDVEFDNLYLDMNGIIHPCCHPENKPAPKNEDEMMVLIFEYIDRIFSICRPRKLLYMAIDGVAPRAKMNQQRSRRFRASKESAEQREEIARIKEELRDKGAIVPPDKPAGEHFDSNCITPGTPFMFRLAECLRYYIHARLNSDPGWKNIKVILSDANVPGEGEHKIMDFIRRQRAQPDHDPNTHHCLNGADADLIMLGLATHEPNFTIIREEFKPNQPRPCALCNQLGHDMKECQGLPKEKLGENGEMPPPVMGEETEFIFIRLNVLREYLEQELQMTNLPFKQDMERAIDDWVFMCFFVGNDFLPHLPSLEIREGAIDRLIKLYKDAVYKTGGYLTDSGIVAMERVQLVLSQLGEVEDEIFKKRRETELDFRRRNKLKRQRERRFAQGPRWTPGGQYAPQALGNRDGGGAVNNPRQEAYQGRVQAMNYSTGNQSADALKGMLSKNGDGSGEKRKAENQDPDSDPEPEDEVKLWEDGWKQRYYQSKFGVSESDVSFRHQVAREYVLGLCWVLQYYYQGCPSWKWYFPHHYAPFASDFINIGDMNTTFEKHTQPFKPLEQLMGVFPAASKKFLPPTWQELMYQPDSPIIDFYPTDFKIDLNGKKYAWQGVALLPFVDEKRLKAELSQVYPDLTPDEVARNIRGPDRLFVSAANPSFSFFEGLYEDGDVTKEQGVKTDPSLLGGILATVWCDKLAVSRGLTYPSPLDSCSCLENNQALVICYDDPEYGEDFLFPAKLLEGAVKPPKVLKPGDFERAQAANQRGGRGGFRGRGGGRGGGYQDRSWQHGNYRPQLGFTPGSHYRDQGTKDLSSAKRHIQGYPRPRIDMFSPLFRHGLNAAIPPPPSLLGSYQGQGASSGHQQQYNRGYQQSGSSQYGGQYAYGNRGYDGGSSGGGWSGASGGGGGGGGGGWSGGNQGGRGGNRISGAYSSGGGGGAGGGAGGWQRNNAGQQNAYQQNQQRGYQQQQYGGYQQQQQQQRGSHGGNQQRDNRNRDNRSNPYPAPPRRY